ncbi:MAG: DedA family protein [Bacteroidales bacterium]|nr:DedA family protein [Bacteroidales bacterium]
MEWLGNLGLLGLFLGNFLAATIIPFSSDALYVAALMTSANKLSCFIVATTGNWLGSVLTYWMGRIARWEWIEKWFRVKRETILRQKEKIDRYGVWMALIVWVPFIGDVIAIALGFYRSNPFWTILLLLLGKAARFLVWTLLLGI